MTLRKHGTGEVLPEPEDHKKTAKANFTEDDAAALKAENEKADSTAEEK